GLVVQLDDDRLVRPSGKSAAGHLAQKRRGRYHLIPDDRALPFIAIPDAAIGEAVPGDRVLVSYNFRQRGKGGGRRDNDDGRFTGRVITIIDPRPDIAAGVFSGESFGHDVVVFRGRNKPPFAELQGHPKLVEGQVIRVKLSRPRHGRGTIARFIETVSNLKVANNDVESIATLFEFPVEFSGAALAEIDALPDNPLPKDVEGRLDLRDQLIITIDPADAKDHDDAISVEQLDNGFWRLGVHIADVSHYVRPGTHLAQEATERGTSVYLPGKTIPMLPEKLSAGLCSLMDGRDRLAKSCFITYDNKGRVLRRELYRSVINVKRFFNYAEVLDVLEGRNSAGAPYDDLLKRSRKLADAIRDHRVDAGSLTLDIKRPHLVVDKEGDILKIEVDHQDASHNLIEEFMIAGNRAVASFMIERGMPYIGRIHPPPEPEAEEAFAEFCEELKMPAPNFGDSRRIQLFLDGLKGLPGESAIHLAVLKSMKRAEYAPKDALHYALATSRYTHFTSPIRRLCDIVVHQMIEGYWDSGGELKYEETPLKDLAWIDGKEPNTQANALSGNAIAGARGWRALMPSIARQAVETSYRSERAEMETVQLKLLRTLEHRIGEIFDGTVVHIGSGGVSVQLDGVWAEGSIPFSELSLEWVTAHKFWAEYETDQGMRRLRVGDRIKVAVDTVDIADRSLRLKLSGKPPAKPFQAKPPKPYEGRRKSKKERKKDRKNRKRKNKRKR
ncbi:MAG: ribonuclease R, partial [Planctomycetes bacterium]|nr:ribonuclease R [Planctomycetota bacterium]